MKKSLQRELTALADVDFRELQLALQLAQGARDLVKEFKVSPQDFCLKMGITLNQMGSYLAGSFPYTIHHLAKKQAYYVELHTARAAEKAAKEAEVMFLEIKKSETQS